MYVHKSNYSPRLRIWASVLGLAQSLEALFETPYRGIHEEMAVMLSDADTPEAAGPGGRAKSLPFQ